MSMMYEITSKEKYKPPEKEGKKEETKQEATLTGTESL